MKIWIDFINTPQVSFFLPFISQLREQGHEFILTCRLSGNTVDILDQNQLEYTVIGKLAGSGILKKILYFPFRIYLLFRYVHKFRPDVAVGQSSFYLPIVSWILRVPSIYTNDNEHAKGNITGLIFANKLIFPQEWEKLSLINKRFIKKRLQYYPGIKEGIYLSQKKDIKNLVSEKEKRAIYFRPEPWSAQYYKGALNFFDDLLIELSSKYNIVVLPRDNNQKVHYQKEKFCKIKVAEKPILLEQIIADCLLFIGAGGSMTRELACLGVPVISVYQDKLLEVDKYLVDRKYMVVNPNITIEEIEKIIKSRAERTNPCSIMDEGNKAFNLIKSQILKINNGKN